MKGISLSVNTIIIIVLAVIVLLALALLFSGAFTPGQNEIMLKSQQATLCSHYLNFVPECDITTGVDDNTLKEIARVGDALGYGSCTAGQKASVSCVQECCRTYCSGNVLCDDDDVGGTCYIFGEESDCEADDGHKDEAYICPNTENNEAQFCCVPNQ